jgi:UPF0755 protein
MKIFKKPGMVYRSLRFLTQIYLNGIIFVLFLAGYAMYLPLKALRLMQLNSRIFAITASALLILACGILLLLGRYYLLPFGSDHQSVELIIEPKMSLHAIADTLERRQVIRSAPLLRYWMHRNKTERAIKAGLVMVERGDGILSAGEKLLHARPIEISVMIPEGLTIEQTVRRIARVVHLDTARFIALCNDTAFVRKCGISASSLEGYLFPDTYRLP